MSEGLATKSVLVSGGGSGIGRSICQRLATDGAYVIVADIDANNAQETADSLAGHRGEAIQIDVSDTVQVESVLSEV